MPLSRPAEPVVVTPAVLHRRPLPDHRTVETKYDRGIAVIVGGSAQTPGGVLLAATAALRVGAGKAQIATVASAAPGLAVAIPEARVIGLPETADGSVQPSAAEQVAPFVSGADAVLVGTSACEPEPTAALLRRLVPAVRDGVVIVDAAAIPALADDPGLLAPLGGRVIVMPNPKEMADLLGCSLDDVDSDPAAAVGAAVERLGVTVTLRATEAWTTAPNESLFRDEAGNPGLATSGSGDVLAGAIAGLGARGADPLTATVWATHLHRIAAGRCAARLGTVGYLARELLDELPLAHATLVE